MGRIGLKVYQSGSSHDVGRRKYATLGMVEVDVKETAIPLATGVTEALELVTASGEVFYIVGGEAKDGSAT